MCETIIVQHALSRASVQCEGQKLPYKKNSSSQDFNMALRKEILYAAMHCWINSTLHYLKFGRREGS